MIARLSGVIVWLAVLLSPVDLLAEGARPRSILVLDQSDLRGSFYREIYTALLAEVTGPRSHVTVYAEDLDLRRFNGEDYETSLRLLLKTKYRDRPIGVLVAVGAAALELALRWRAELWPQVPVVFAMLGESDLQRLRPSSDVTGYVVDLKLADSIKAARAVVPGLERIFIVGDAWDRQIVFRGWKDEIATAAAGLKVTEMMGLTMDETRRRVSALPDHSAIVYSSMHSDGEGTYYPSSVALSLIAETANRPIIVSGESLLSSGGIGGYSLVPGVIGVETATLALQILKGEPPPDMPRKLTEAVKPMFNWPLMQRWGVRESDLPPGSEIHFRSPDFWETYRWRAVGIAVVILMQAGLISILLHERKKRGDAELEARDRLSELAHVGRQATAGELSSSIAHELNQPLGAILTNAETAELMLQSPSPDLAELREILADIRRDDQRASEVIHRMRSFLKRTPFEIRDVDLNDIMRGAFEALAVQASARNVALYFNASPNALPIKGDPIQLQQVILNLIVNSMDAVSGMPYGRAVIGRTEVNGGTSALASISDSGRGIPSEKLNEIFDPFYTTKKQGMGIGLSIARTIVQAHKGSIWAENLPEGGAVFRLSMPLATH